MTATTHERHPSFASGLPLAIQCVPSAPPRLKSTTAVDTAAMQHALRDPRLAGLFGSLQAPSAPNLPFVMSADAPVGAMMMSSSPIACAAWLAVTSPAPLHSSLSADVVPLASVANTPVGTIIGNSTMSLEEPLVPRGIRQRTATPGGIQAAALRPDLLSYVIGCETSVSQANVRHAAIHGLEELTFARQGLMFPQGGSVSVTTDKRSSLGGVGVDDGSSGGCPSRSQLSSMLGPYSGGGRASNCMSSNGFEQVVRNGRPLDGGGGEQSLLPQGSQAPLQSDTASSVSVVVDHTHTIVPAPSPSSSLQLLPVVGWDGVGPAAQAAAHDEVAAILQTGQLQTRESLSSQQQPIQQPFQWLESVIGTTDEFDTGKRDLGCGSTTTSGRAFRDSITTMLSGCMVPSGSATIASGETALQMPDPHPRDPPPFISVPLHTNSTQQNSSSASSDGVLPQRFQWLQDYLDVLGEDADDKHVFIALNRLPLPAVDVLAGFLTRSPRIRVVTLVHVGLDDHGAYRLALGLRASSGDVWTLDLRHNRIGDKGALALASCLPACSALREVVLSHNNIGDKGVLALAEAVLAARMPVRVRVSNNPCEPEAVKELLSAYRQSRQKRARSHKTLLLQLQQLERLPDSQSPTEGIFDHVLAKESVEEQSFLQRESPPAPHASLLNAVDSWAALAGAGGGGGGGTPVMMRRRVDMRSHSSAALIGSSCNVVNPPHTRGGDTQGHVVFAQQNRRSMVCAGGASPREVGSLPPRRNSQPISYDSLRTINVGYDDLDQLCSLLRVLFSPSLPVEHVIAQDVGAALLHLPMLDATPPNATPNMPQTTCARRSVDQPAYASSSLASALVMDTLLGNAHDTVPQHTIVQTMTAPRPRGAVLTRHASAGNLHRRGGGNGEVDALFGRCSEASQQGSVLVSPSIPPVGSASEMAPQSDLRRLAAALSLKGHRATVTTSLGGVGGDCLHNLRHSYITIQVPLATFGTDSSSDLANSDGPCTPTSQAPVEGPASLSDLSVRVDDLSVTSRTLTRDVSVNSMYSVAHATVMEGNSERQSQMVPSCAVAATPPTASLQELLCAAKSPPTAVVAQSHASAHDLFCFDNSAHSGKAYAHWAATKDDSGHGMRAYAMWAGLSRGDDGSTHGGGGGSSALAQISEVEPEPPADASVLPAAPAPAPVPIRRDSSSRLTRSALSGSLRASMSAAATAAAVSPSRQNIAIAGVGAAPSYRPSATVDATPVIVRGPATARIVVDPGFKEQFEIGQQSTERYDVIMAALPRVYVGQEERLSLLVELLCEEMGLAFKERGLPLPPWRRASSMMSKWKSRTSF